MRSEEKMEFLWIQWTRPLASNVFIVRRSWLVMDPRFSRAGSANVEGGGTYSFGYFFHNNCMKMKEIGPWEECTFLLPSPNPPWICQYLWDNRSNCLYLKWKNSVEYLKRKSIVITLEFFTLKQNLYLFLNLRMFLNNLVLPIWKWLDDKIICQIFDSAQTYILSKHGKSFK